MAIVDILFTWWSIPIGLAILTSTYLYAYFITNSHLRSIPAPFPAQFSNLWLLYICRRGEPCRHVGESSKKLGPVVRIQPNHTSIADVDAIATIYGHGNGFLKS